MAFASTGELETFLQTSFDEPKQAAAAQALDLATEIIKAEVGQVLEQATETVTLDGNGSTVILLPQIPVTAVSSVTEDGTLLDADVYAWDAAGILTRLDDEVWPDKPRSVVVAYTHGFATVPATVKAVCLSLAGRLVENPKGLTSQSAENFSITYQTGAGLTDSERRLLLKSYAA